MYPRYLMKTLARNLVSHLSLTKGLIPPDFVTTPHFLSGYSFHEKGNCRLTSTIVNRPHVVSRKVARPWRTNSRTRGVGTLDLSILVRDEATTVAARDGHSEINNIEESHLLILPLIGEWCLYGFADSFAAADNEGRAERKKKRRKKKKRGQGKRRTERKGEGSTGGNAGLVEYDLTLMKTIYGAL